jgi:hypothetical protein
MRVLHVDSGRDMRGGQWQALHLMRGLAERGVDQLLLSPKDSPLFHAAREEHFSVEVLTGARLRARSAHREIAHAHTAAAHTLAVLWARCPIVVSRRVAFPVKRGMLSRWKYARASHYMAVSRAVAQDLRMSGVPADRISIVSDGVPLPASLSPLTGAIIAPYSRDPMKGMEAARAAASIAGVEIHFSRDLSRDLANARLLIYLTALEGLGSAALLAMAHGVPVVASRVGGLPEAVRDGETGLLVQDTGQAAAALRKILDDPDLALRMGRAGRALVEKQFSVDAMVKGTLAVYKAVSKRATA